MTWGREGLWAVNTRFSCLSLITDQWSFTPRWKPPQVTELLPEDRSHLNGLALVDGVPAYATALGATNAAGAWREGRLVAGTYDASTASRGTISARALPRGSSFPSAPPA